LEKADLAKFPMFLESMPVIFSGKDRQKLIFVFKNIFLININF